MQLTNLRTLIGKFRDDTHGSVTVEFILAMPFVFWAFMATYVYFDGYHQSTANLKAAYTISDLISRETSDINDAYVDSMYELFGMMTHTPSDISLRISVIRWDESDRRYYVNWSANRGFPGELDDGSVGQFADRLPAMPDNEIVILVETENTFTPLFRIGMDETKLENFVFTRPRFVDQIKWDGQSSLG
ncbi:TadE/TadG family type IV pilus assembly protein [Sedimentitalea sp. XS_ASV28]|uniref:TadE/TadG family type IV pilus assembly protein n=1 Tax=Sedimentitalea sp. XS_ASV28 TaxID=3241296 RepID=UPI0035166E49